MNNLLTRRGGAVLRRCRAWISGNFGGSSPALCHTAAAVTALVLLAVYGGYFIATAMACRRMARQA